MPRVKLTLVLSSLLLLQIVAIEAQKINLVKINKCLKNALELTSALAAKIVPVIKDAIDCVNYQVKINTERMNIMQLVLLVYQFMVYALNNRFDCLSNSYMSLASITTPYKDALASLKCAYLFVPEPLC